MTLFSVARKNIRGNVAGYAIYFLSMLCAVVIYYTFVSLRYNPDILDMMAALPNASDIFMQASIILIVFVAIFVAYSNAFFIRRRKKELALLALMGVRRRTIGLMLAYENAIVALLVLAAGVALGTFLSKLFAMLLVKLAGSAIPVQLRFSPQALAQTAVVFVAIALLTSLHNVRLLYRNRLADLLRAARTGEMAPRASWRTAAVAVLLLACGYAAALKLFPGAHTETSIMLTMLFVTITLIAGTYMLFRSAAVMLLVRLRGSKRWYGSGTNLVAVSLLMYRVRSNARMLTVIALLSGVTILAIALTGSQYYTIGWKVDRAMPFSYTHLSVDEATDRQIAGIIADDKAHSLKAEVDLPVVSAAGDRNAANLPDYLAYLLERFAGEKPISLVSASKYNEAMRALGKQADVRLQDHETAVVKPLFTTERENDYKGKSVSLLTPDGSVTLTFVDPLEDRIVSWVYPDFYLVVSDRTFAALAAQTEPSVYKQYLVERERSAAETASKLATWGGEPAGLQSYRDVYTGERQSNALDLFLIGFLGLVFLAATGSVLYFKQLTEAHEDRERFEILRHIGAKSGDIRRSIALMALFVFALPLAVGLVHSAVLLRSLTFLYSGLAGLDLTVPVSVCLALYALIYFVYYALTIASYDKIVATK
ncbi:ABC transporter permease [Paenibacillus cymbidii]|uniref:ABC transporter permease n=1 Tax=Paenibacillus cymbidii TaxID=1639034 RepID=UPI0010811F56|nr:ABC transporter permease [Paenibacillus cymbidii]